MNSTKCQTLNLFLRKEKESLVYGAKNSLPKNVEVENVLLPPPLVTLLVVCKTFFHCLKYKYKCVPNSKVAIILIFLT